MSTHSKVSFRTHTSDLLGNLGACVFTSFATFRNAHGDACVLFLDRHLSRVCASARELGIYPVSPEEIEIDSIRKELSQLCVQYNRLWVRVVISPTGVVVTTQEYQPRWQEGMGIGAISFHGERTFPEHKTTNALISVQARAAAERAGAKEAILVDRGGYVRECAWSNLFWVRKDGVVCTPHARVLPGIIRNFIIERYPVVIEECREQDLLGRAQEIFITQSTTGVTPVTYFNGIPVGDGQVGIHTQRIQALYNEVADNEGMRL